MNRLARERSPYLRQHAENPVDWYPWGPEALERAKREEKPILLSVGYSACHWCHVMAHESFEDPITAQAMNEHFVNVKVDREERPDVDQLYQGVVQLMGRGGGWPLTVFLTPSLRPFFGGTYFPQEPRHGLPSFRALVNGIGEAWKNERADLERESLTFEEGLREFTNIGLDGKSAPWTIEALRQAGEKMAAVIDPRHGGFGPHGPRFPNPMNLAFMLRAWRRGAHVRCRDGALHTLEKMCLGGVHDQLGGGFHRYSVDERWLVPHFEKMLYDNAQLLHLLAEAWLIAPRPLWKQTAERLVEWLTREMTSSEGTFFAAQDADSEGEEGKFFVWTPAEIRTALGNDADAELICQYFDVTPAGNFEESSSSVLSVSDARIGDARIEALRVKLFEARRKRIAPGLDDKVLAGWNGLTIRGLATAATAFERDDWAQLAARAAEAFATGTLKRTPVSSIAQSAPSAVSPSPAPAGEGRGEGVTQPLTAMLEDYGDLISGLVALFQRTQDARWLARAEELADTAYDTFWDAQKSAWRAAPKDASDLVVTPYAVHDNAFPSGASTLAEAQVALTALTGRPRHLERARIYLERMREEALRNPLGFGHLLIAADLLVDGSAELTLIADPERLTAWRTRLAKHWLPTLSVVAHARGARAPAVLDELLAQRGGSGAFLCQHFSCRLPVDSDEALEKLVAPFGISPTG